MASVVECNPALFRRSYRSHILLVAIYFIVVGAFTTSLDMLVRPPNPRVIYFGASGVSPFYPSTRTGTRIHAAHVELDQVSDRSQLFLMSEGVNLFMR